MTDPIWINNNRMPKGIKHSTTKLINLRHLCVVTTLVITLTTQKDSGGHNPSEGYLQILNLENRTEHKNAIMDEPCEAMKIDKRLSTAYYSQSNVALKELSKNVRRLLKKLILGMSEEEWDVWINSVQLMINCKYPKDF
ncbi:hypothetical protein BD560DRAFT_432249 [Blakeslea trispora]|nr:hypothetical protein BD560DRAFT_432249 [Blakeslea trispora]